MPYKEGQPTLIDILVRPFLHIEVVKKDAFGKPYVYQFEYFILLHMMFQSGAILGRMMCNKIDEFKKMLLIPNYTEGEVLEQATKAAEAQLADFKKEYGNEPSHLGDFIHGELFKGAIGLRLIDCGEVLIRNKKRYKEIKRTVEKKARQKVALSQEAVYDVLTNYVYRGIGFGMKFPELTEKLSKDKANLEGEMVYIDATADVYSNSISNFWKLYAEELGLKKDVAKVDKEAKAVVVEFAKLAGISIGYRETGDDCNRTK